MLEAIQPLFAEAFTLWGSGFTWLEIIASGLGVWMVVCNMRVDPLGWPLAMASSLLYALFFANGKLFGEASLQLFFIVVAGWGWWQWLRGTGDGGAPLRVHRLDWGQRAVALGLTAMAWPLLGLLLKHYTHSEVPFLDALATVGSITGTVLLGRKLIENWPVWVAVNVFSVGLFASRGWWLTVLLYALFTVMALAGWRAWHRLGTGAGATA
jgi:nicotinamide mononucleotide transporter